MPRGWLCHGMAHIVLLQKPNTDISHAHRQSKKEGKDQESINQAPHLTQDINEKVTTSQLNITNESQDVSPFPAGDRNASTNRRA